MTLSSFAKIHILSILLLATQRDQRTFPAPTAVSVLAFPSSCLKGTPSPFWLRWPGHQFFSLWEKFTSTWNQSSSRNPLHFSRCFAWFSIVYWKTCPFAHLMILFLSNLVKNSIYRVCFICKLAMEWYVMRMCTSWLCPFLKVPLRSLVFESDNVANSCPRIRVQSLTEQ